MLARAGCEGMPVDSDGYPYQPTPTLVTGFRGQAVLKVACGGVHNLAITEPDQSLALSLSSLVNSETLADVAFRSSEGSVLYAHLCILKHNALSLHSYVMAQLEEGTNSSVVVDGEQQIPLVALANARKEVLLDFMQYVYTLDIDAATMSLSSFSAVLELYHLGDRSQVLHSSAEFLDVVSERPLSHPTPSAAMGRPKPPRLPGREARRWDDPDSDEEDDDGQEEFHPQTDQGQPKDLKGSDSEGEKGAEDSLAKLGGLEARRREMVHRSRIASSRFCCAVDQTLKSWDSGPFSGIVTLQEKRKEECLWDPLADLGPRKKQRGGGNAAVGATASVPNTSFGRGHGPPAGSVVILQGLSKAPQLNGKTGTVAAAVDGATGRCQVLLPDNSVKSLKVLTGAVVRLKGLQAAPELNGKLAECGELELTSQRYSVTLADGKETIKKEPNLEVVGRYLQPKKYLATAEKPFTWKVMLQKGKDLEHQSWSARLKIFAECGLPPPHFVAGSQLVDPKSMISPATTAADQLPAVSTERDSCIPSPTKTEEMRRLRTLAEALQKRDAETQSYFLIPGLCTEVLSCMRSSASLAWLFYLQLCQDRICLFPILDTKFSFESAKVPLKQAVVCLETPHHAHKAWSRLEELVASQVLSQPVYLLGGGSLALKNKAPAERAFPEFQFNLTNLLPKCRRLIRQQLGKQNLYRPSTLNLFDTRSSSAARSALLFRGYQDDVPSDEPSPAPPAANPPDFSPGAGDGWGIFFLPTGQALVLDDVAYRETLARGTLLDLQDIEAPIKDEDATLLEDHMRQMLADKESCDVTLVAGESDEVAAHKCVLASRSSYFRALFSSEFRERSEGRVLLEDITFEQLILLLNFIYADDWLAEDADFALDMIPIADRFSVLDLKRLCERTLIGAMSVDNVARVFALADKYSCNRLRSRALLFMTDSANFHLVMKTASFAELDKVLILQILHSHKTAPAPAPPPSEPLPGNSVTLSKAGQSKMRDHRHGRGGSAGAGTARPPGANAAALRGGSSSSSCAPLSTLAETEASTIQGRGDGQAPCGGSSSSSTLFSPQGARQLGPRGGTSPELQRSGGLEVPRLPPTPGRSSVGDQSTNSDGRFFELGPG
eukprot:s72_g15.t1